MNNNNEYSLYSIKKFLLKVLVIKKKCDEIESENH